MQGIEMGDGGVSTVNSVDWIYRLIYHTVSRLGLIASRLRLGSRRGACVNVDLRVCMLLAWSGINGFVRIAWVKGYVYYGWWGVRCERGVVSCENLFCQAWRLLVIVVVITFFQIYTENLPFRNFSNSFSEHYIFSKATTRMASPITSLFAPSGSKAYGRKDSSLEDVISQLRDFKGFSGISTEGRSETPTYVTPSTTLSILYG